MKNKVGKLYDKICSKILTLACNNGGNYKIKFYDILAKITNYLYKIIPQRKIDNEYTRELEKLFTE